ncbi:MAG TPA: hypothetical protein DCS93_25010 [Microscillaceae bacterium]|nr:hypothetical protein [Microscillaceae bacterium]
MRIFTAFPFLIFLLIFSVHHTFGQQYSPGYIIKVNGDTLRGFVNYKAGQISSNQVKFKTELSQEAQTYRVRGITGFKLKDDIYLTAKVKIDTTKNPNKLTYDSKYYFADYRVFLQVLTLGPKSLFYYKGPFGIKHFYIQKGNEYELLLYKKYLKGERVITEDNRYKGQLLLYLSTCSSIKYNIENIVYGKRSLTKLFKRYYDCTLEKPIVQEKIWPTTFRKGIVGGAVVTRLSFKDFGGSNNFWYLTEADFTSSTNATFGIFVEIVFPGKSKRWSLYNELSYHSYSTEASSTFSEPFIDTFRAEYDARVRFEVSYLKMTNLARFMPRGPNSTIYPFFNFGISNGAVLSSTNEVVIRANSFGTGRSGQAINGTRGVETGLVFGLGMILHNFTVEGRYERGNGIASTISVSSPTNKLMILLGLRF